MLNYFCISGLNVYCRTASQQYWKMLFLAIISSGSCSASLSTRVPIQGRNA